MANSLAVLPEKKPVRQADKANIALAKDHLPSILGLLHIGNNHIRSLRMKKMMLWVGVLVVILGGVLRAQSSQATPEKARPMAPNADPSFEVATIKPTNPDYPADALPLGHRIVFPEPPCDFCWHSFTTCMTSKL